MTFDELESELAEKVLRPAYLLAGPEVLYRDDSRTALRAAVIGQTSNPFGHDVLRGDANSPGELIDSVRTLPVFGNRRLVELVEPESRRSKSEAMKEALVTAVEELCSLGESGSCVLVVSASRVDRRSVWVRSFKSPAVVIACDPPKGVRAAVQFVRAEAKRQRVVLAPGTAESLAERTGADLLALRHELAKVALYAGEGENLTTSHVTEAVSDLAEEPIWALTDAIGTGNTSDALKALHKMLRAGAVPQMLLGALASHFRKLFRLRCGGQVKGHPYAVKKLTSQAHRYKVIQLEHGLKAIWKADEQLKGVGSVPAHFVLERLVQALSH